jgi:hypothetical protein
MLGIHSHTTTYWLLCLVNMIIGVLYYQNFITVLKKQQEEFWICVPFYGLMMCTVLYFATEILSAVTTSLHFYKYYFIISVPWVLIQIFLLISVFKIQNQLLSFYYKIYAGANVAGMMLARLLPAIIALSLPGTYFVYSTYGSLFFKIMNYIPIFIALLMQYKLYKMHEVFDAGDEILLNKEVGGMQTGAIGVIFGKHSTNYYEVEFTIDEDTHIIPVSTDDMARYDRVVYERPYII